MNWGLTGCQVAASRFFRNGGQEQIRACTAWGEGAYERKS